MALRVSGRTLVSLLSYFSLWKTVSDGFRRVTRNRTHTFSTLATRDGEVPVVPDSSTTQSRLRTPPVDTRG